MNSINGNIHHKILFYDWSSFFFFFCWIILFLFCTLHLLPNKRKHADNSQRFNKNYKDGLQLKIRSLRSSSSTSQKKELILWGLNGKALTCLLMMDEKFKSMKLKACGYKMRLVAFALDRVCLLALEIGILFAFLMKTLISCFFFGTIGS